MRAKKIATLLFQIVFGWRCSRSSLRCTLGRSSLPLSAGRTACDWIDLLGVGSGSVSATSH
jgi:hypothetical protein